MPTGSRRRARRIAAGYFAVAGTYIVVSGVAAFQWAPELSSMLTFELVKGMGFVAVTSALLYGLLRRHLDRVEQEHARLRDTEQALRHNRHQLERAQRLAHLGSWEADLVTRRVAWSDEVYRIFGVTPETFGHTIDAFVELVHPDDRRAVADAHARDIAGEGVFDVEHRVVRPDGTIRHVHVRATVARHDDERPVQQMGTVQDITERKTAELELLRQHRQQKAIAELGMNALSGTSLQQKIDDVMNAAADTLDTPFVDVLELSEDRSQVRLVAGRGWHGGLVGQRTAKVAADNRVGHALAVNGPVVIENLATDTRIGSAPRLADHGIVSGVTTIIHGGDAPWGLLGVFCREERRWSDSEVAFVQNLANLIGHVAQRERAMRAIRERNFLRQVASTTASLGGWIYDVASERFNWSPEVARIFEVDEHAKPGTRRVFQLPAPEQRERMERRFQACIRDGVSYDEEVRSVTFTGREIWVRIVGQAMRDDHGQVVQIQGAVQDISERKRLESMLHQSQRLEAVGQLTGGIAHDFNNLLTVILGNVDLMLEYSRDRAEITSLAETTRQAAQRGAELTSRLLAYARKQPLDPVPTDVGRLLASMDQLLRRTLGEQIEIETVRGGGLWPALADPSQLESAVLNLCLNARDAMPEGGRLTLETANVRLDQHYASQHDEVKAGQYVMIAVTDTGHGIDPGHLDRLFEPFFTTKTSGQGNGLGLSMVYGFAKQSAGHVKVYSEPGRGTTVKLYLPRSGDPAVPQPAAPAEASTRGNGETILVVEDDELVRQFVAEQVEALGYRPVSANDADEALEQLRQRHDIALLFTDVVMPGAMDGRALAQEAQALHPGLPVLFTSGYTENAIVHQGRLDPGVMLLNKPYRISDLAEKLHAALANGAPT
ncbi:MAG: PAS domain-containing protein [Pseudomonadota bacterium]